MAKIHSKQLAIGKAGKRTVFLNLRLFLRTRMLITANSGGGKSYLLRLLAELLFPHVQVIIIDPEGEYNTLREKYGYGLVGPGGETAAHVLTAAMLAHRLLEHKISAICDLSELKAPLRHTWIRLFLEALMEAPRHLRRRVVIIVDESHLYCPEKGQGESEAMGAMLDIAGRGRKRGICAVFASQRHAKLSKNATAELLNRLVGPTFEGRDIDRAIEDLSIAKDDRQDFAKMLKVLEEGNFNAIGRAISKSRILFKVNKVKTKHPDPDDLDQEQITEPPPPPQKVKSLLAKLADLPKEAEKKAKTEADLKKEVQDLRNELGQAKRSLEIEKRRVPAPASRLVAAPPPPPRIEIAKVEIPVVKPADLKRLETVLGRAEALHEKLKFLGKPVEEAAKELRAAIGSVRTIDSQKILDAVTRKLRAAAPPPARPAVAAPVAPGRTKPAMVPKSSAAKPVPQFPVEGEEEPLNKPQIRMLGALAAFEAIRSESVPRSWIAAWMGIKVSGSFMNNLGGLRTRGLVEYEGPRAGLTDAGRAAGVGPEEDLTTESLLRRALRSCNGPQQKMLTRLHELNGWTSREELADALGLVVSGSFMNNLGGLRTAELVEYGEAEHKHSVKVAEWMMLNVMV